LGNDVNHVSGCERRDTCTSIRRPSVAQSRDVWVHDVGVTQMITASLGVGNNPTFDDVKRAADEYNLSVARHRQNTKSARAASP